MVLQVVEDRGLDLVLLAMNLKRGSRGAAHQRREQPRNRRDAGDEIRDSHVDELTEDEILPLLVGRGGGLTWQSRSRACRLLLLVDADRMSESLW